MNNESPNIESAKAKIETGYYDRVAALDAALDILIDMMERGDRLEAETRPDRIDPE